LVLVKEKSLKKKKKRESRIVAVEGIQIERIQGEKKTESRNTRFETTKRALKKEMR